MNRSETCLPDANLMFTSAGGIEQKVLKTRIRIFRTIIFVLLIAWCAGFSLIALFPRNEILVMLYPPLKKIYSWFCHQDHEKSFNKGEYFLVCARCTGIYFGAAFTALISIIIFPGVKIHLGIKTGLLFAVPLLCDVVLYNLGMYNYSPAAALCTGLIFGSAVIIFILSLIENNFFYNSTGLN